MIGTGFQLDHVAVVVPDLDRGRDRYARLGFNLSPRSSHRSRVSLDAEVELWGTGNHCAMFERGYLEILGVTDPHRHRHHVDACLARYPGLHLIALGCDDAVATAADLRARLGQNPEPAEVQRDVPAAAGTRLGRFNILPLEQQWFPEADLFFIEHLTPDALWQPDTLQHPNGVLGLASVSVCSNTPQETWMRLSRILDLVPAIAGDECAFKLAQGCIRVTEPAALEARYPGISIPRLPFVAAVHFKVEDIDATIRLLRANEVPFRGLEDGSIQVAAGQAEGAVIVFEADVDAR